MMKLLKYDWKRNAVSIFAAFLIFAAAQIALTTVGRMNDWDGAVLYVVIAMLYGLSGFLAFLMACQTFNSNIKAYSRRLLPLPSLYTVVSPVIMLLASHLVICLLYIAHDWILSLLFAQETLLTLAFQYADLSAMAAIIVSYVWGIVFMAVVIFFSMTFSQTVEGKAGTFLGIVVCLAIFSVISFVESFISPNLDENMGLTIVNESSGNEMITANFGSLVQTHWGVTLFELAAGAVLVYGIVYMMNRKMKL